MYYYVSKNHSNLNGRIYAPEKYTSRICLNPIYNVKLTKKANKLDIMLDSGAFQDLNDRQRLSFQGALDRQIDFEEKVGFKANYIVSYDRMVDETPTVQGHREKRRVGKVRAERYVRDTVDAAKFMADSRKELKGRTLVLSNQGINPKQYLQCVKEILEFAEPSDIIGFGGFCIIGRIPSLEEDYFKTLANALPLIKEKKIKRIHLFGVGVFKVLLRTQALCYKYGIDPSYDTSSLEMNAVYGRVFHHDLNNIGPAGVHMSKVFYQEDKYKLYHPVDWALINVRTANFFWNEVNKLYSKKGKALGVSYEL